MCIQGYICVHGNHGFELELGIMSFNLVIRRNSKYQIFITVFMLDYTRFIQYLYKIYTSFTRDTVLRKIHGFHQLSKWNFTLQSATVNNEYVVVIIGYLSY